MKLKLFALTLIAALLASSFTYTVFAEETSGEGTEGTGEGAGEETSEDAGSGNIDPLILEQIKQETEARYQELYNLIFGQTSTEGEEGEGIEGAEGGEEDPDLVGYDGPVIPEGTDPALRNQFMHAWMAMQQAQSIEGESPQAAAQQYLQAMKQLRNAWRKYQKDNPEVVEGLTEETGEGEPVAEGEEVPTDDEITEIQQQLIERFQERFQEQLTNMFSNYNEVQGDLSPGDAVKAQNALYHAEQKLLRIQERIQAGEYDEALDELDETTEGLDEEFDGLEDPASAQMFRTMNQYEARITKMVEKMERKAARGEDTSEDEDLLNQLRGNVNSAKNEHKENKGNGNGQGSDNGKGKPEDKGKPEKPDKDNGNK
jgi:hypothetical protein